MQSNQTEDASVFEWLFVAIASPADNQESHTIGKETTRLFLES